MALLPELRASIPPTVTLDTNFNRTTTIRASVKDIEFTMLLTVALVVMVIFLFLRNVWATIIPSIAVPLSIVGTFGVMYAVALQSRQSFSYGAGDLHGFCRGRRDRGD